MDLPESNFKPAEVRWCPMVVSGSAVSLVIKTVMGGLLSRRFGSYHLDPFDAPHTLEFVYKLSRKEQIQLSEEAALGIHRLTGGNPMFGDSMPFAGRSRSANCRWRIDAPQQASPTVSLTTRLNENDTGKL